MASWQNGQLFAANAVRRIHHYAHGIPRLINSVCDIAMLAGYVASSATIDVACVNKAIKQLEGLS